MERCPKGKRISKKVPEKNMKLPSQRCDPQTKKELSLPWIEMVIENVRGFPGDPVVKTRSYHCRGGAGSDPDEGTKIPHASQPKKQNINQKQRRNRFSKDFLKWSTS